MAKTFGSTVNQLLDELERTGQLTSQCHTYLNSAIEHYRDDAFKFNEQVATANTLSGEEYLDLPADWGEEYGISIDNKDGEFQPMIYRTMGEMDELFSTQQSRPIRYTIFRQQLRLSPIPDSNLYSLKMTYRVRPETATAEAQTNIFYENANDLIRGRAGAFMARMILRDEEVAGRFDRMEVQSLTKLRGITARYQSSGHVKRRR